MIFLNIFCNTLFSVIHAVPLLSSLFISGAILYGYRLEDRQYDDVYYTPLQLFATALSVFAVVHFIRILFCLILEIVGKWILMGRRTEGRYNWDTSSYNQDWEFYQILTRVRKLHRATILDFLAGTPFLVWYFRALGSKIGKDCCLYPAGGDPYMPEPDLVQIGDRCVMDLASIVTHLNTRGNFELVKITLEDHVTLRSRSRIQQGVHVEAGAMLLEKSLALTGEVIESNTIWQGSPASRISYYERDQGVSPSISFDERCDFIQFTEIV